MKIETNERLVLQCLYDNSDHWGERCISFDWIMSDTKLSRKEVQKACKGLREKQLAQFHRGLMNDDNEVAGSGYCISTDGQKLINPCDECEETATYDWWEKDGKIVSQNVEGAARYRFCDEHYPKKK